MQEALIIEDLPEAQQWLKAALTTVYPSANIRMVKTLAGARIAVNEITPDIALVDIGLPDGSGIDLIDELNQRHAKTVCIVTSIFDDDAHLFSALRAGAKGYILKDQSQQELANLLTGIVDGRPPLSPAIARRMLNFFTVPEAPQAQHEALTVRESEVLTLIAKGYTIAKVGEMLGITRNTAAGYVKLVYRKLNVNSRAEATLEATRMGIVNPNSF